MQDPIYNPPESTLDSVCAIIADPAHSLHSAAEALNTTPAALSLFILKPEISAKLLLHTQAAAFKARISACQALPEVTDALRSSIQEFAHETRNAPYQLESSRAVEYRRRSRETARKTGALLLRIATFDPAKPPRPSTPRPPRTQFLDQAYSFSLTTTASHLITSSYFTGPQPISTPPSSPSPASASASSSSASAPASPSSSSSSSSQISNLNSEISCPTTSIPSATTAPLTAPAATHTSVERDSPAPGSTPLPIPALRHHSPTTLHSPESPCPSACQDRAINSALEVDAPAPAQHPALSEPRSKCSVCRPAAAESG